jgi:Beta-L-arabinofuranosidase, GH127
MSTNLIRTQLGLMSVLGWRIRQSGDQGVVTLITELGDRCLTGIDADPTALGAIEAAIRLNQEEVVAAAVVSFSDSCRDVDRVSQFAETGHPESVGAVLSLLCALAELLEGPVADRALESLELICARTVTRLGRLKRQSASPDDPTPEQLAAHKLVESELIGMIDLAAPLLRAATHVDSALLTRARSSVRHVLDVIAGNELHRLVLLGGNAQRVTRFVETLALIADDPRRRYLSQGAINLFDELVSNRLYLTGAIAEQPNGTGHDLVRPFGANHIDGFCRTCTTLGWLRALVALRPVLASVGRETEVDRMLERVMYNALLVSVGTDPTRWFGPTPHGIDRNEEHDLFDLERSGHRFAPGPWRPNMRSGGVEEQCCATSSLLGFALVSDFHVFDRTHEPDPVIELAQLTPGETVGDGWELSVSGSWPFEGELTVTVRTDVSLTLQIRIPDWHEPDPGVSELDATRTQRIACSPGSTTTELVMPAVPRLVSAHPLHSDIRGCVAMTAGPFVYCLEGADQMGQLQPRQVRFDADGAVTIRRDVDHPEAHPTVHATGEWRTRDPWPDYAGQGRLGYRWWRPEPMDLPVDITFVPFYTIANRGLWEMAIWIPLATPSDNA